MVVVKTFLGNIAVLVTCAYVFSLVYKYLLVHYTARVKQSATVALFIVAGWITMLFGTRIYEDATYDLRIVPIVFAALLFRDPRVVVLIGAGIGAFRLVLHGISATSIAGFGNAMLLGLLGGVLVMLFERRQWSFRRKSVIAIFTLHTVHVLLIGLIGIVPSEVYFKEIAVITYPVGLGLIAFFVFVIRDFYNEQQRVSELRNMNLILRRQTHELREAKRLLEEKARQVLLASTYKSEFMANMSHELKTPLNSIILLSQLIQENEERRYEAEDIRYAELIQKAGDDLLQLINDILDLSKVEAGKMDIMHEPVAVEDHVQLLYHQFLPTAEQRGLDFGYEVEPGAPLSVHTDGFRMNQILRNLLANAFKFTEQGSVRIIIAGEREGDAQWLTIAVRDTGIGIDPDKQQLIFDAFQQGDGSINRRYGGTGLGLSISLQLARLLGGDLRLESAKTEGSMFTLRLPADGQPGQPALDDEGSEDPAAR